MNISCIPSSFGTASHHPAWNPNSIPLPRRLIKHKFPRASATIRLDSDIDANLQGQTPKLQLKSPRHSEHLNLAGHINVNANLGFQRANVFTMHPAQQALFSIAFVLCTTLCLFSSLLIIAIPTLLSFRRLLVSVQKLLNVIHEEVPGTIASLKLSGIEINDLTQHLSNLRQRLRGRFFRSKDKNDKPINEKGTDKPIIQ